ncbi:unnamed protein product [Prorocentrum cordatum]|uniref:Uncharacterized protein n=1 Tax=Prorocentrum cordatum TaxID=2364126 RepID=A0ABN9RUX0_9DINO|nr:unnamed protein product [Polarella glacialis]
MQTPESFRICTPTASACSDSFRELISVLSDERDSGEQGYPTTARLGFAPLAVFLWTLFTAANDVDDRGAEVPDYGQIEALLPVEAWSRRYYRQSSTDGVEVSLVRRKSGNRWAVLVPGMTLGLTTIAAKSSFFSDPIEGIRWRPLPLLIEHRTSSIMAQATQGLQAGTVPELRQHAFHWCHAVRPACWSSGRSLSDVPGACRLEDERRDNAPAPPVSLDNALVSKLTKDSFQQFAAENRLADGTFV